MMSNKFLIYSGSLFGLAIALAGGANAQSIIPSPVNGLNTTVNQVENQYNILGGTQAGNNLFHSLHKLGLSTGEIANFSSNPSINNILTRVTGSEASLINGLIQVTGGESNLFIMNPAGIVFGREASLNVPANFSATTAAGIKVGNAWFGMDSTMGQVQQLSGQVNGFAFTETLPSLDMKPAGVIANAGILGVDAGNSVTLVGGRVINTGTIATPGGNITIAATEDNKFIQISNEGSLMSLELPIATQQALGNVPVLRGVDLPQLLIGKPAGTAIASGNLNVSGNMGGNVQILGNTVNLVGAKINASGLNGGGTVLVGGEFQGLGTTPTSQTTTVDSGSLIRVDALTNGNGGQAIIWSDGNTYFNGTITAKAGTQSGDGGLVETSGLNTLIVGDKALVNTTALQGETGTWLLDPIDLTVVGNGTGTGTITGGNNSSTDSTINNSTIVTALNSTNVNLTATNSITVNAVIDTSSNSSGRNLTLTAPTANLNARITLRSAGILSGTATTVNVGTNGRIQNGVDAVAAGGTVNLAAATYVVGASVSIGKSLTLNGAGAANTIIDGNGAGRVFSITGTDVTLDGLSVVNGNSANGGGIRHTAGTLNINNSRISNNVATDRGGGIINLNSGTVLNITNSTISNNTASGSNGGGIQNESNATLNITNSTISGNSAASNGGGLRNTATATLRNVTIANNTSTTSAGGLFNSGTVNIGNTIVANNTSTASPDIAGTFVNQGNNLIGKSNGSTGFTNGVNGNIVGTIAAPVDPLLGALANNGGSTQTHALLIGSPGIEAGNVALAPATDQRGLSRFGRTDIGAYEYQFKVTNTNDSGLGSFRSALTNTNNSTNTETVIFRIPTTDTGYTGSYWSIAPTSALPTITKPVIIDGYTQAGATPNTLLIGDNTKLAIELTGTNAGTANGLVFGSGSGGSTLKGLAINNFNGFGVWLQAGSDGNAIAGNFIGTDITGTTAKGNTSAGIRIDSANNLIGGTAVNARNAIAFNTKGIVITGNTATGNQILGNRIFSNTDIGIDLNNDGITANDINPRTLPNNGQNYPLLITASGTNVSGILNSLPNTSYRLEFFASDANVQGQTFLGTTNVTTDANGIATFSSTITAVPAGQVLTATATNTISGTSEFAATPGINLTATAGASQSTTVDQAFATPLQVTVRDTRGNLAGNGIPINFAVTTAASGATGLFTSGTTVTTNNSIAIAPIKANTVTGTYNATASATGASSSVNFLSLTNTPDVPDLITATGGNNQSTVVNTAFGNQLQVLVRDQFGNVVPNSTVTFTSPNSGASTSVSTTTATTDVNGIARVSITANTIAGNYTNTARTGALTPVNFSLINTPDVPALITATGGNNQSAVVNTAFGNQLQVLVRDQFGNVVPNSTVTFTSPNSGASTAIKISTATTDANGVARVSITANTIAGKYSNTATSGTATAANFSLTNTPDVPALIAATGGNNQSTVVNTAFANQLQVVVKDQYGNVIPNSTVTFTSPNSGASTSVTTTTATTDVNGVARVSITANTIAGNYTNTARTGALTPVNFSLINTPDVPALITATGGNNQSTVVNTAFGNQLQVLVKDQYGNVVPNSTVTFTSPNSGASTAIKISTATTDANGVARVSITANTIAGKYSNTATSGTATAANFSLTNTPDVPALIAATGGNNQSTVVNTAFANQLQVVVKDQYGNVIPNSTVTFTSPNSGASTSVSTTTATTDVNGVARVSITANTIAGNYTNTARTGSLTPVNFSLINTPDVPALITATGGNNQSTVVNTAFGNQLQVLVKDQYGNVVPNSTVTFTSPNSGASTAIKISTATTDANGVARVSITANTIAGKYSNTATSGTATAANFSLTNTPDVPALIAATGGNNQSTVVNTAFANQLQVVVKDQYGNVVPNSTVTFTSPNSSASTATKVITATTDANGLAQVSITANTIAGNYTNTATSGTATAANFSLTNNPDVPALIIATGGNNQSTVVNTAFGNQLQVLVKDQYGNVVPNSTVTFTSPNSGASTAIKISTATTDANGVARVSITANTIAGKYSNTATSGTATAANFSLTNNPDVPALITATSGNNQSTVVNTAFANQLQVLVKDQYGNVVPNSLVTFTSPNSGASTATKIITATTDANGLAQVSIAANTIAGSYTNTATSGTAIAANFDLTNNPDVPALITATGGNNQSTLVNTAFGELLQVLIQDQFGNPIINGAVTFTVPNNGASGKFTGDRTTITVVTDLNGRVQIPISANHVAGNFESIAKVEGLANTANFSLTNIPAPNQPGTDNPDIDPPVIDPPVIDPPGTDRLMINDPELLRQHKNQIIQAFFEASLANSPQPTTVAFLLSQEIDYDQFSRLLLKIVELMNDNGGELSVSLQELWQDSDISLLSESVNQDIVRVAIHDAVGRFIGSEYIELVNVDFVTQEASDQVAGIQLKVRKAPQFVELKI